MNARLRKWLSDARHALPHLAGRVMPAPDARAAARICARLHRHGLATTAGFFQGDGDDPQRIVAVNLDVAGRLRSQSVNAYLSVKAPPLGFDRNHLDTIAAAGLDLMFDAHAPAHAGATLDLVSALLPEYPGTGAVLPARWRRSVADAARFRDSSAAIRIVKGEWADSEWPEADTETNYLAIVASLAGRSAKVAVATHQPSLAERALGLLVEAGTPCELEQLRGLPDKRTRAIARRLGVPVRVYVPFGPGWWPYAVDQALARRYLPIWAVRDALGIGDGQAVNTHERD